MIDREAILKFLAAPDYRLMRRRELARAVGAADHEDYREFCELLGELEADGRVVLVRGRRYALAEREPERERFRRGHGGAPRGDARGPERGVPGTFISKGTFGFVRPDAGGEQGDFYVPGAGMGGAMDGDKVLVEPRRGGARGPRRSGRVVRIIERAADHIVGILRFGPQGAYLLPGEREALAPVEVNVPPGTRAQDLPVGHKVAAKIIRYPTASRAAVAEVERDLGPAGTLAAETAAVIAEFGLRESFPPEALAEAEGLPGRLPEEEIARRADYRAQPCLTIDPPDAADFDDAVYLERRENGWRLYVHIADVSWYVRPGAALDTEARARSTSVYLPGRVLPMLPPRISSDLCSLRPGEERAAQTAVIDFTSEGERKGCAIQRSAIRSSERMNYDQVRRLLEGQPGADDEVPGPTLALLAEMRGFSQKLRARRFTEGSVFLDVPEVKVLLDEQGETVGVEQRRQDFSHHLIEEFMLAANRAVAEYLVALELPGIFRVHEPPDEDKLGELAEFLKSYGLALKPPYTRGKLQHVVESARGQPFEAAVSFAVLTSLKQARYSATAAEHYALAFEPYCHFTSPIRRYPDLIVHRALAALYPAGAWELPGLLAGGRRKGRRAPVPDRRGAASWMESAAVHASLMERRAAEAERRLTRFRQLELLKRRAVGVLDGIISGVTEFGLFVRLDDFLVEGLVHVSSMNDRYRYNPRRQELSGLRTGRRWQLGDRVSVTVLRAEPATGRLDLELAGNP